MLQYSNICTTPILVSIPSSHVPGLVKTTKSCPPYYMFPSRSASAQGRVSGTESTYGPPKPASPPNRNPLLASRRLVLLTRLPPRPPIPRTEYFICPNTVPNTYPRSQRRNKIFALRYSKSLGFQLVTVASRNDHTVVQSLTPLPRKPSFDDRLNF